MKKAVFAATLCLISVAASAENVIVKQARQAGVKQCMPAVEKIADYLVGDGDAGIHSVWSSDNPDNQAFTAMIERNYSDGSIVANLVVAPVKSGECYVEYEKIIQFNKSCLAASRDFKGANYKGELNKEVAVMDHDAVSVYLIPSGNNSIVVRKEVIMEGRKL